MGWADPYIARLKTGEIVEFRPRGGSMSPRIESGQLVEVMPYDGFELKIWDIVLCEVKGQQYLHMIRGTSRVQRGMDMEPMYLIGNNKGRINGWVGKDAIYGVLVRVIG